MLIRKQAGKRECQCVWVPATNTLGPGCPGETEAKTAYNCNILDFSLSTKHGVHFNICLCVGPSLLSRLKHLNDYLIDCHAFSYTHWGSPEYAPRLFQLWPGFYSSATSRSKLWLIVWNIPNFGQRFLQHHQVHICSFGWKILTTIRWFERWSHDVTYAILLVFLLSVFLKKWSGFLG